jgi:hypothetical protein
MKRFLLVVLQACLAIWLGVTFSSTTRASSLEQVNSVSFFDVLDLPARIDEPKLRRSDKGFVLDCAVANRSGEQLMGIRLILLVIDTSGKLRSRIAWNEPAEMTMYSIKTFAFHPEITTAPHSTDQLFLGVDEVIGRETIWRASGAEKALRAYSRGQHDVVPTVRTFANKYDPRPAVVMVPLMRKE